MANKMFIVDLSDLKKIIEDAQKMNLPDTTPVVFKDSDGNEYTISNRIEFKQKNKKIYLEVE